MNSNDTAVSKYTATFDVRAVMMTVTAAKAAVTTETHSQQQYSSSSKYTDFLGHRPVPVAKPRISKVGICSRYNIACII